jgi:RHS repeat-associated protein
MYDRIGNLIYDVAEDITSIEWTVYGKIRRIEKGNGAIITYYYDAAGNRISKEVEDENEGIHDFTYYFRDAQGNVMGVYKQHSEQNLVWKEQHLYGSSRLGMWVGDEEIVNEVPDPYLETVIGSRHYELTNHLGNVLTVVTDKKKFNGNYWEAEVINVSDYYPGGMQMPGRLYAANINSSYRYGFNGKELDSEVVQYDYGFRIYDPRIVRFKSVDPLFKGYPWNSPYSYAEGDLIRSIDLDGLERFILLDGPDQNTVILALENYDKRPAHLNRQVTTGMGTHDVTFLVEDRRANSPYKGQELIYFPIKQLQTLYGESFINDEGIVYRAGDRNYATQEQINRGILAPRRIEMDPNRSTLGKVDQTHAFLCTGCEELQLGWEKFQYQEIGTLKLNEKFGEFGKGKSIITEVYTAPESDADVTIRLDVSDNNIYANGFTVIGQDGNVLGSFQSNDKQHIGIITFTVPANSTFSVQVSGDKNNSGDNYTIQGSATTTKTAEVLVPKR